MPDRNSQTPEQPTPVADDANATVEQLLARAAQDLAHTATAHTEREQQGGNENRDGVLPGEDA